MKILFLWFTYNQDEITILHSIDSVRLVVPNANILVADDGFNSCPVQFRERCKQFNIDYIQTDWQRNGNLIGPDHLIGYTKLLASYADKYDIICKIDCDTVLFNIDWIERLYKDPDAYLSGSFKTNPFYPMGNAYAIKTSICQKLYEDCVKYPSFFNSYEDYEIGVRIFRLSGGSDLSLIRYKSGVVDGFWLGDPSQIENNIDEAIKTRVVSCGFSLNIQKNALERQQFKQSQISIMSKMVAAFREKYNKENSK